MKGSRDPARALRRQGDGAPPGGALALPDGDAPACEPPEHLVRELLEGRCVAFVGAGFSANVPRWKDMLQELARLVPESGARDRLVAMAREASTPLEFEAVGQLIRDAFGRDGQGGATREEPRPEGGGDGPEAGPGERSFEHALARIVRRRGSQDMERRQRLLREIPFAAILTTNYDGNLEGERGPELYQQVLRRPARWWARGTWEDPDPRLATPVVKLHGDANGDPEHNPVVFARRDYRRLLYHEANYANFLRAVFATRTVLFLGVSFTDSYLNELRSEVLSLLRPERPIAYAVLADRGPEWCGYFAQHEGIEVLSYDSQGDSNHSGFDRWLEAIHGRTSVVARLRALLAGAHILWLDARRQREEPAIERLERAGATVEILRETTELSEDRHRGAKLLVARHGDERQLVAFAALDALRAWPERPPVLVFADETAGPSGVAATREATLRRGAVDCVGTWQELFRAIEVLFGPRYPD